MAEHGTRTMYVAKCRCDPCREANMLYARTRYAKDAVRNRETKRVKGLARRQWLRELKESTPCADCGQSHPWWRMEFDHTDGTTYRERGRTGRRETLTTLVEGAGWEKIHSELATGEFVCANCHKDRTHARRDYASE